MKKSDWARLVLKLVETSEKVGEAKDVIVSINDINAFVEAYVKESDGEVDLDYARKYVAKNRFRFIDEEGIMGIWIDERKDYGEVDYNSITDYIYFIVRYMAEEKIA